MSDAGPDSLIRRYLRALDSKVDGLIEDMREVTGRLAVIKDRLSTLERRTSFLEQRMARFDVPLERIERRLGLLEPIAG